MSSAAHHRLLITTRFPSWVASVSLIAALAGCVTGVKHDEPDLIADRPSDEDSASAGESSDDVVPSTPPAGGDERIASPGEDAGAVPPATDPMAEIYGLYEEKDFNGALLALVALSRQTPPHAEIEPMRQKILKAMSEQRTLQAVFDAEVAETDMAIEATEKSALPETYRIKKLIEGEVQDHVREPSVLDKALQTPVSIHLKAATLSSFINAISKSSNLNIIADKGIGEGKQVDIEVDDVPLKEILDYMSRNYGVDFVAGENMLWVMATDKKSVPLVTRMIKLHKGHHYQGSDWGEATRGDPLGLSLKATEQASTRSYLIDIIEKFVPAVEGAQLNFAPNVHTLFVKNTPENVALIERIVTVLDVNPVQVLIEARYVEVTASDLRELGVEWILDSPLVVSEKGVLQDGEIVRAPATQIDEGDIIRYTPFASDDQGAFPLGPQGSFGELREGNPPTAAEGLNFTYQGILTEPMFQAVLHALEISGKSRTLSVPRVTTLNNSPAKLRNGDDLRFYEEFEAQVFNLVDINNQKYTVTSLIPKGEPKLEELGITLVAVPSVGDDMRTISLLLTPTLSRLEGFISYQDEQQDIDPELGIFAPQQVVVKLPIIARREIQTKVVVESGETVVLGGLIETVKQDTVHKVPYLGSIPFLGNLFKRIDVTEERKNLLVFVTATVITERGESLVTGP